MGTRGNTYPGQMDLPDVARERLLVARDRAVTLLGDAGLAEFAEHLRDHPTAADARELSTWTRRAVMYPMGLDEQTRWGSRWSKIVDRRYVGLDPIAAAWAVEALDAFAETFDRVFAGCARRTYKVAP